MQPPQLADTAERDYFTLKRETITMQKQLERRSILMSSADRVAHIDGQLMQLLMAAVPRLAGKSRAIHLQMFAGFLFLTTFSAPPQICASTVFFCT